MKETERRSALLRPFFLSRSLLEKPLSFSLIPSTRAAIAIFSLQFSAPASLPSTTRRKIFPLYSSVFPPLFSTPAREKSCILYGRENLRVKNPNEKEARPFPLLQFLFLPRPRVRPRCLSLVLRTRTVLSHLITSCPFLPFAICFTCMSC